MHDLRDGGARRVKRFSAFLLALLVGFSAITSTAGPFGYHFPLYQASGVITPPAPPPANLAHHYKLNTGLTQAGGFASAWDDQVGTGHLLQATAAKQPAVQGDGSLLFDGSDDFMQAMFTLNQPCTVFVLLKPVTWIGDTYFFDGGASNDSGVVAQIGTTPEIVAYAGSISAANGDLTVGAFKVVAVVFNGASSVLQVDANTATTGDFGASNMGGFTLASVGGGTGLGGTRNWSNIQVKEILIYDAALDATARGLVRDYLATVP